MLLLCALCGSQRGCSGAPVLPASCSVTDDAAAAPVPASSPAGDFSHPKTFSRAEVRGKGDGEDVCITLYAMPSQAATWNNT